MSNITNWYRTAKAKEYDQVISVDFDETIAKKAEFPKMGEPIVGVAGALRKLRKAGYKVRIFTCRLNGHHFKEDKAEYLKQKREIEDYLKKHDIPHDGVVEAKEGKIFAEYYIDDKGIHFDGQWNKIVKKILGKSNSSKYITADRVRTSKRYVGMIEYYDVESTFTHKVIVQDPQPSQDADISEHLEYLFKKPKKILWGDPVNNFWGEQWDVEQDQLTTCWRGASPVGWDPKKAIRENKTFTETVKYDIS